MYWEWNRAKWKAIAKEIKIEFFTAMICGYHALLLMNRATQGVSHRWWWVEGRIRRRQRWRRRRKGGGIGCICGSRVTACLSADKLTGCLMQQFHSFPWVLIHSVCVLALAPLRVLFSGNSVGLRHSIIHLGHPLPHTHTHTHTHASKHARRVTDAHWNSRWNNKKRRVKWWITSFSTSTSSSAHSCYCCFCFS